MEHQNLATLTPDEKAELERQRHECEVRAWWHRTGGDPAKIRTVLGKIEKQRGRAAAGRLRHGLRDLYQRAKGQRQ